MGNICMIYKNNEIPNYQHCKKCTCLFRVQDRFYYIQRRSCAFHNIKNGKCRTCNSNGSGNCFHEKKYSFF